MSNHASVVATVAAVIAIFPACQHDQEAEPVGQDPDTMRHRLERILADATSSGELEVVYNDMHAFHGGQTLSLHGDTLRAEYLLREGTGRRHVDASPVIATSAQLHALVSLLLEIEAWEQRVPQRDAVPDESIAGLRLRLEGMESNIWEWYNDLSGNDRLVRVKSMLESIAGAPPNS